MTAVSFKVSMFSLTVLLASQAIVSGQQRYVTPSEMITRPARAYLRSYDPSHQTQGEYLRNRRFYDANHVFTKGLYSTAVGFAGLQSMTNVMGGRHPNARPQPNTSELKGMYRSPRPSLLPPSPNFGRNFRQVSPRLPTPTFHPPRYNHYKSMSNNAGRSISQSTKNAGRTVSNAAKKVGGSARKKMKKVFGF